MNALHLVRTESPMPDPGTEDALSALVERKTAARLAPITDALHRLKAACDAWLEHEGERVAYETRCALLTALGEDLPPVVEPDDKPLDELRAALRDTTALVAPAETPAQTVPAPPPSAAQPTIPSTRRPATPEDLAEGARILGEIDAVATHWQDQHVARLGPLLQAIVAEARLVIDRLPRTDEMADKLGTALSVIGRVRRQAGVNQFIHGLTFESSGDWPKIATACRRKITNFDKDIEAGTDALKRKQPAPQHARNKTKPHQSSGPVSTPLLMNLPNLRRLERPVIIAGGMQIPERLASARVRSMLGDRLDWHAIDHDNPKAAESLVTRVRGGHVGALILIEGFMRHDTYKPLSNAADIAGIPYAYAGKGGTGGIESALTELEAKLTTRPKAPS